MAIRLDSKEVVSFEELLMSQVVQQEAITRLLVQKGIFTKEELLEVLQFCWCHTNAVYKILQLRTFLAMPVAFYLGDLDHLII